MPVLCHARCHGSARASWRRSATTAVRAAAQAGVWALLLLGAPQLALAVPADANDAPAAADAASPTVDVAARLRACIGREDPACIEATLPAIEAAVGDGWTMRYARGHRALLQGQFAEALELLDAIVKADDPPAPLRASAASIARVARASELATRDFVHAPIVGGRFEVWVQPGPDEVLIELMDEVLSRAVAPLERVFGPLPVAPIRIHVYPRVEILADVTGLTQAQIRTSGTIAVCKYNRLMVTSPRDLVFGYPWADTVVHELVHLLVTRRAGPEVPIWLHEAIARSHEGLWRDVSPETLDDDELAVLHHARKRGVFVPFSRMSPTMAALPSQDMAQLAFAECHHALRWLLARQGQPLAALLDRFAAGDTEADALAAWAGMPRPQLLAAWNRALRKGENLPPAPTHAVEHLALRFRTTGGAASKERPRKGADAGQRFAELGDRLLALERPAAAVVEYRKAAAAGAADDVWMWTRMARALLQQGQIDEAIVVVTRARVRSPWHPPLLLIAAQLALRMGDNAGALAAAQQAIWINPFDPALATAAADASAASGDTAGHATWQLRARRVGAETPTAPTTSSSAPPG